MQNWFFSANNIIIYLKLLCAASGTECLIYPTEVTVKIGSYILYFMTQIHNM